MQTYNVMIDGDTSVDQLAELVGPLIGLPAVETDAGVNYDGGVYFIADCEKDGVWYEDDLGIPLSRYRFQIGTTAWDSYEWARRVFALLSARTTWDLLWLADLQHVEARRPALVPAT